MLAMQCDIRIAAEDAKVSVSSARFGRKGASWMAPLARQISLGNALELALWGDTEWTAQRAYEAGWVQRVVPGEQLLETALDYARRAISMAPQSVRNFKQAIYRGFYLQPEAAKQFGVALDVTVEGMQDTIEGAKAFSEKRQPRYIDG
jgi:enoyl-CoA hydratase/carnithine racemase